MNPSAVVSGGAGGDTHPASSQSHVYPSAAENASENSQAGERK